MDVPRSSEARHDRELHAFVLETVVARARRPIGAGAPVDLAAQVAREQHGGARRPRSRACAGWLRLGACSRSCRRRRRARAARRAPRRIDSTAGRAARARRRGRCRGRAGSRDSRARSDGRPARTARARRAARLASWRSVRKTASTPQGSKRRTHWNWPSHATKCASGISRLLSRSESRRFPTCRGRSRRSWRRARRARR